MLSAVNPESDLTQSILITGLLRLATPDGAAAELLQCCGIQSTIDRLPNGMESKVRSDKLSWGERKMIALARILLGSGSVWLLDDVVAAVPGSDADEFVGMILNFNADATIVVACRRPVAVEHFDRVIELEGGACGLRRTPSVQRASESATIET